MFIQTGKELAILFIAELDLTFKNRSLELCE